MNSPTKTRFACSSTCAAIFIFLFAVAGTSRLLAFSDFFAAAEQCLDVEQSVFDESYRRILSDGNQRQENLVLVATFFGLKEINEHFDDGGVAGEHISNVLQYLFQTALQREWLQNVAEFSRGSDKPDRSLRIYSPIVKYSVIRFSLSPAEQDIAEEFLLSALDQTVDQASLYLSQAQTVTENLLFPASPSKNSGAILAEGLTRVSRLSEEAMSNLRRKLAEKLGGKSAVDTAEKIRHFLSLNFSLGLAVNEVDAQLYARLQAIQPEKYRSLILFRPHELQFRVREVETRQEDLSWLFTKESKTNSTARIPVSDDEKIQIFALIRKNSKLASAEWDPKYTQILERAGRKNGWSLSQTNARVIEYVRLLNLFDFLPERSLISDPEARTKFDQFENPQGTGLVDIRNLGAQNLAILHREVKNMAALLRNIKLAIIERGDPNSGQLDPAKELKVRFAVQRMVETRAQILKDSDRRVRQTRNAVKQALLDLGLKEEDFVIWGSGDDIFFTYRNFSGSAEQMVMRLMRDDWMWKSARLALMENKTSQEKISLLEARAFLGPAARLLKQVETLNRRGDHAAVVNQVSGSVKVLQVKSQNSEPLPLSTYTLNLLRRMISNFLKLE